MKRTVLVHATQPAIADTQLRVEIELPKGYPDNYSRERLYLDLAQAVYERHGTLDWQLYGLDDPEGIAIEDFEVLEERDV